MIYWLNQLFRSTSNSRGDCGAIFIGELPRDGSPKYLCTSLRVQLDPMYRSL